EAGNILAKQLSFLANADSAGLVVGARVPVILTSRADSVRSRIASCAVAVMAARARRQTLQVVTEAAVMTGHGLVLVLNAGSSSLKFCVYRCVNQEAWQPDVRGQIEGIGTSPRFSAKDEDGRKVEDRQLDTAVGDAPSALDVLAGWLRGRFEGARVLGVG